MPVVSRFYGIVVYLNYNDHNPPHFHARYQDQEVTVEIQSGLVTGSMSRRALLLLFEWADLHRGRPDGELAPRERAPSAPFDSPAPVEAVMFLHVTRVRPLEGFELWVEFDNGIAKRVDLSGELHGEVFAPLRDPALFAQLYVDGETGTLAWPNGADFAPEFLFEIGRDAQRVA